VKLVKVIVASNPSNGLRDMLAEALRSHKMALELNNRDADLLFNAGQLSRSMGEFAAGDGAKFRAHEFYSDAAEVLSKCYQMQKAAFEGQYDRNHDSEISPGDFDEQPGFTVLHDLEHSDDGQEAETWVSIVAPVTAQAILDTIVAGLETITELLLLTPPTEDALKEVQFAGDAWTTRMLQLIPLPEVSTELDSAELQLALVNFKAVETDSLFKWGRSSLEEYEKALEGYCSTEPSPQRLCDEAEAHIRLELTLSEGNPSNEPSSGVASLPQMNIGEIAKARWKHLTHALDAYTTVSKMDVSNLDFSMSMPEVHARRAECELLRRRLGEPDNGALHSNSRQLLASNAETYYRGADLLHNKCELEGMEEWNSGQDYSIRAMVSTMLAGKPIRSARILRHDDLNRAAQEMNQERLLSNTELEEKFDR